MPARFDFAILGGGFGGSLLALILRRLGRSVLLLERDRHPRFALGESSTPMAGLILQELCSRYDLPRVAPLAEYGSWQSHLPQLACGLKRGFTYFRHIPGQEFSPRADHANELLVAASAAAHDADMHWYRADVDAYLFNEARDAGAAVFEECAALSLHPGTPWRIEFTHAAGVQSFDADFVIDATGFGGAVAQALQIPMSAEGFQTRSRALFGHFMDVAPWRDVLAAADTTRDVTADHLFPCDDAALHHLGDAGWMFALRFNNGITSAGFLIDLPQTVPAQLREATFVSRTSSEEWEYWMSRYPSIARQFERATLAEPFTGPARTQRLQRLADRVAGENWAMLPLAAYSLDALHSTGNAHNLSGIERLAAILAEPNGPRRTERLALYSQQVRSEVRLLDLCVAACYRALRKARECRNDDAADGSEAFEYFTAASMLYFIAATSGEHVRHRGGLTIQNDPPAFLQADDAHFVSLLESCSEALDGLLSPGEYFDFVARTLRGHNLAGLCDRSRNNLYPYLVK